MRTVKIKDAWQDTLEVRRPSSYYYLRLEGYHQDHRDCNRFSFTLRQALRLRKALDTAIKEMERKKHDHKQ